MVCGVPASYVARYANARACLAAGQSPASLHRLGDRGGHRARLAGALVLPRHRRVPGLSRGPARWG
jgi:hypothetical protein